MKKKRFSRAVLATLFFLSGVTSTAFACDPGETCVDNTTGIGESTINLNEGGGESGSPVSSVTGETKFFIREGVGVINAGGYVNLNSGEEIGDNGDQIFINWGNNGITAGVGVSEGGVTRNTFETNLFNKTAFGTEKNVDGVISAANSGAVVKVSASYTKDTTTAEGPYQEVAGVESTGITVSWGNPDGNSAGSEIRSALVVHGSDPSLFTTTNEGGVYSETSVKDGENIASANGYAGYSTCPNREGYALAQSSEFMQKWDGGMMVESHVNVAVKTSEINQ